MIGLLVFVLSLVPPQASSAPSPALPSDLDRRFAAARADPAQVVELIVEASRRIAAVDGDTGHAIAERLEPFSRRAFFSPERPPAMQRLKLHTHTVAAGELPARIARRWTISPGLLGYLNERYDERRLAEGTELKVLDAAGVRLVVDRRRFRLAAWLPVPAAASDGAGAGGWLLAAYVPVGLGAPETPTPLGSSRIADRVLDPPWTDPATRKTHPPGSPENILGGYWMRLDERGLGVKGIGLHGFTGSAPETWLGQPGSNGCVRLRQADMDRIFHLALEGTPVAIVE